MEHFVVCLNLLLLLMLMNNLDDLLYDFIRLSPPIIAHLWRRLLPYSQLCIIVDILTDDFLFLSLRLATSLLTLLRQYLQALRVIHFLIGTVKLK